MLKTIRNDLKFKVFYDFIITSILKPWKFRDNLCSNAGWNCMYKYSFCLETLL